MDPSWTKEHQSGFPQIRQGLRRLTRQKMFEVDIGMALLPPARFSHQMDLADIYVTLSV
jgi:hypothetical protein